MRRWGKEEKEVAGRRRGRERGDVWTNEKWQDGWQGVGRFLAQPPVGVGGRLRSLPHSQLL